MYGSENTSVREQREKLMLKVAVAGCGFIAERKHIPAFLALRDKVKVVAICGLDEGLARQVSKKFNISKAYHNFSQMLREQQPDVVDICTPPSTHASLAVEAMEGGAHVLLEKPMALDLSDCNKMVDLSTKSGRKVCIIHNQIFNPAFMKAKELFLEGAIGDFLGMRLLLSTHIDYMTSRETHWAHKLPGGVLGETGPHAVYMSLAFLQDVKSVDVYAKKFYPQYPWSGYEDFRINLIADNGVSSITLTYGSNQWAADLEIFGKEGILRADLQTRTCYLYKRSDLTGMSLGLSTLNVLSQTLRGLLSNGIKLISGRNGDWDSHSIEIRKFVESILKGKEPPVTGSEGRKVIQVMEMIVERLGHGNG